MRGNLSDSDIILTVIMALDLSVKSTMAIGSLPLDLSKRKTISPAAGDVASVAMENRRSKPMSSACSKSVSNASLRKVRFAGNSTRTDSKSDKLKMTWSLKKRLLTLHREAYIDKCHDVQHYLAMEKECIAAPSRCQLPVRDASPTPGVPAPTQHCGLSGPVPPDPREWSRLDVQIWLEHLKQAPGLEEVQLNRFPTNGKGLCLMNLDMFLFREPQVGHLLYRDFTARLSLAMRSRQCQTA